MSHGTFLGLSALLELHLSHNQLVQLEGDQLLGLPQLQLLALHHNQLSSLPPGLAAQLPSLRRLSLHHNQLVTLRPGSLPGPALLMVTLRDNRWRCDRKQDCGWVTQILDNVNSTSIADRHLVGLKTMYLI